MHEIPNITKPYELLYYYYFIHTYVIVIDFFLLSIQIQMYYKCKI
jgi:hypothetical protein